MSVDNIDTDGLCFFCIHCGNIKKGNPLIFLCIERVAFNVGINRIAATIVREEFERLKERRLVRSSFSVAREQRSEHGEVAHLDNISMTDE